MSEKQKALPDRDFYEEGNPVAMAMAKAAGPQTPGVMIAAIVQVAAAVAEASMDAGITKTKDVETFVESFAEVIAHSITVLATASILDHKEATLQ